MKKHILLFSFLIFCNFYLSAQWEYLPGPDGGYVINLEKDGNTLYALTRTGIYRSEDEGYHWQFIPGSRYVFYEIEHLTVENGIFYGINTHNTLMRSEDGQFWQYVLHQPILNPAQEEYLTGLFAKGDTVLLSSTFTIYRSVDRGETWTSTSDLFGLNQSRIFSTGSEFFSWSGSYIHRSSDGGLNWDKVFSSADLFSMVAAVGNAQYILYRNMTRLIRSTDGFRTWKTIDTDSLLPVFGLYHHPLKLVEIGDTLYCIGKINSGGCASRFCYSTDEGSTWQVGNNGNALSITVDDLTVFDKHLVFSNTQTGISHSTDGCKTFTTEQAGLTATFLTDLAAQGKNVFATGNQTVYYSKNNGIDWEETAPNLETAPCDKYSWMLSTQKRLYLIRKYGEKFYSEDAGASWKPLQAESYYPVGATQNCIWGYNDRGLRRICDDGVSSILDLEHLLDGQGIENLLTSAHHVIVVTDADNYLILNEEGKLLRKTPFSPCDPLALTTTEHLHFDGHNLFYFCGENTYVLREGVPEWQLIYPQDWTTGIPLYHNSLMDIATYKGVTFIALDGKGIFYSTDATGRFYPLSPQLPDRSPWAITFRDNSIWVNVAYGGIYTLELPLLQADASKKPVFQHSPNPSDGHLHLQSNVFFTDEIQLDVLDMAGRLAGSTILRPGQTWELDFPTLSKGLYVLMLRTPLGNTALKWSVMK